MAQSSRTLKNAPFVLFRVVWQRFLHEGHKEGHTDFMSRLSTTM
jgi:hypothetical protein